VLLLKDTTIIYTKILLLWNNNILDMIWI